MIELGVETLGPADAGVVRVPVPVSGAMAGAEVHVVKLAVTVVAAGVVAAATVTGANAAVASAVCEGTLVDDVAVAEIEEGVRMATDVMGLVWQVAENIEVHACQKLKCLASMTDLLCHSPSQIHRNHYESFPLHHQHLHRLLRALSFQYHHPKHHLKHLSALASSKIPSTLSCP